MTPYMTDYTIAVTVINRAVRCPLYAFSAAQSGAGIYFDLCLIFLLLRFNLHGQRERGRGKSSKEGHLRPRQVITIQLTGTEGTLGDMEGIGGTGTTAVECVATTRPQ